MDELKDLFRDIFWIVGIGMALGLFSQPQFSL